jgi:prepilin signal peptidase PulO-like enzyme (type II secretory pathway)
MDPVNISNYVIAVYFGLVIGNFATSFYFRIPRGITLLGFGYTSPAQPSCSTCGHFLKFKEYIPILGYISCNGRCNYCLTKIDFSYLIIEVFSLILSVFCYSQFYFLDWYIIFMFFGISSLMMSMLLAKGEAVSKEFLLFAIFWGIIYKTLLDLNVYDWVLKLSVVGIISALIMQISHRLHLRNTHFELFKILTTSLIWFDLSLMIPYAIVVISSYFLLNMYSFIIFRYIYNYSYIIIFLITIVNHLIKI